MSFVKNLKGEKEDQKSRGGGEARKKKQEKNQPVILFFPNTDKKHCQIEKET